MVQRLNRTLEDVILTIKNSNDYIECIRLKEKMKKNRDLMCLIETLKTRQKELVKKGNQDKKYLEEIEQQLYDIPIYSSYMQHLEKVNYMISYVQDELNDYFYNLFN